MLLLLLMLRTRRCASVDEHFHQLGLIPQNGVMQGVVAPFINFGWVSPESHQSLDDSEVSISGGDVESGFPFYFQIDDRIERCNDQSGGNGSPVFYDVGCVWNGGRL